MNGKTLNKRLLNYFCSVKLYSENKIFHWLLNNNNNKKRHFLTICYCFVLHFSIFFFKFAENYLNLVENSLFTAFNRKIMKNGMEKNKLEQILFRL